MKKLFILMSIISLNSLAMNFEKNSYDYDHEILKELEEILDDIVDITEDNHIVYDIKSSIHKNNEAITHILQESHIIPASLSIQHDAIRNQVQGKLVGLYLINEAMNKYKALFVDKNYQILCRDGICYERFAGQSHFKPAVLEKAVNVLQPNQIEKIFILQTKREQSPISNFINFDSQSHKVTLPNKEIIEERIRALGGGMQYFLEKSKIHEDLGNQKLSSWHVVAKVEEKLFFFTMDLSIHSAVVYNLRKCEIIGAILKDNPEALKSLKGICNFSKNDVAAPHKGTSWLEWLKSCFFKASLILKRTDCSRTNERSYGA